MEHQLLICADCITMLGETLNTVKRNTQTVLEASKEVGVEVNMED